MELPGAQMKHLFLVTMGGSQRKLELILLARGNPTIQCVIQLTHSVECIVLKHEGKDERVSLPILSYDSVFHFGGVILDDLLL